MSNKIFLPVSRRNVLRTVAVVGLWGMAGCGESSGVQTVETPPSPTGTRAKLNQYKDAAENAAKKNKGQH
jgi:hypothetical protein